MTWAWLPFCACPCTWASNSRSSPPKSFRRPIVWAELISRHRGTITAGPNFAYSVLTRALQGHADPSNIDLSSLRVAVNAAEPIDHRLIAEFTTVGAWFGMRATAVMPGYGLAEATLVVSLGAPHHRAMIDKVSHQALVEAHRALRSCGASEQVQHVVCVGTPVTSMEV